MAPIFFSPPLLDTLYNWDSFFHPSLSSIKMQELPPLFLIFLYSNHHNIIIKQ